MPKMSDSMAKFMEMTGQDGATATNFLEVRLLRRLHIFIAL